MRQRLTKIVFGLAAIAAFALGGAALASGGDDGSGSTSGSGYTLDDGGSLQAKADISIGRAVDSARSAAAGDIGEIDLEYYGGTLVYNVDVGSSDVKVDAATGAVLGQVHDD